MKTGSINTFNGWSRGWSQAIGKILLFLLSLFIPIYMCAEENAGIPNAFLGDRDGILVPVLLLLVASLLVIIAGLVFHLRRQKRKLRKSHEYLVRYITSNLELKKQVPGVKEPYPFYPPELTPEEFTKVIDNMLRRVMFLSLFILLLTGCAKDDNYNTSHPDKGAVMVQVDWSVISPEIPVPGNYVLNIDGEEQTVSGSVNTFGKLAEPGSHTLLVYNRPEGISIGGDVASVNKVATGRVETDAADAVHIEPMPAYLFASCLSIDVQADDTLKLPVTPQQYVKLVEIELAVTEGNYERVTAVTGTLGGVERSVNIQTGKRLGVPASARTAFARSGNKCNASFRLIGTIAAQQQTLTVDITFSNGDTQSIVSDLSEQMKDFNANIAPLKLTGDLRLPLSGSFTGSIGDWQQADGGNTDAQ